MYRLSLISALAFCTIMHFIMLALSASSDEARLPTVLAISGTVGEEQVPSDPEVVSAVIEMLRATNLVQVLPFSADLPAVRRAVLERRLDEPTLKQASDPKKAVRIAGATSSDYVVIVEGSVSSAKVMVILRMFHVSRGDGWTSNAEGEIPSGGAREGVNRSNTISTASSSAVSQMMIAVFGQDAALGGPPPASTALPDPPPDKPVTSRIEPEKPRDVDAEYQNALKQADAYIAKNDTPNAVASLRRAVDLKPFDSSARLRLAQMYAEMDMAGEMLDECRRALLFDRDNVRIHEMLLGLYLAGGALQEAAQQASEIVRLNPDNIEVRLTLGDLHWNQGDIEQAERIYKEASQASPDSPAPHERLQRLYVARKMYPKALEHLVQAKLRAAGQERDESAVYRSIAQAVGEEFNAVAGKLQRAREDFTLNKITREDYYQECRDASSRIDAVAGFLSTQTAPREYRDAHPHAVLAVSLLAQAAGYMVSYLETDKQHYSEQASLLQSEANTELKIFSDSLRAGRVEPVSVGAGA